MEDNFFKSAVPLTQRPFEKKIFTGDYQNETKTVFAAKKQNEIERPEYAKKCWRNYRFT